ncbi:MAG: amidohydrolase family protein [Massilia sp.]|nr:amidohydrolase family protein [Massilia sp.]
MLVDNERINNRFREGYNKLRSPLVVPGISLHLNLRAAGMVMSNHQALQTVTINSARYAKVDKDLGSVEVGKLADLVAVRGNPLEDLSAAANVQYVIKNGNVLTPAQILAPFRTPPGAGRARACARRLCEVMRQGPACL